MKNLKIYSITHKKYQFPNCSWIIPFAVGSFAENCDFVSDQKGNSISHKNSNYNEITAQYWVRNNSAADFIGFCHYRRYFLFTENNFNSSPEYYSNNSSIINKISQVEEFNICNNILNFSDVIVPRATFFPNGLKSHYIANGIPLETWDSFSRNCSRILPETLKYIPYLENSNYAHMRNMYIMPWHLFCSYFDKLILVIDAVYSEIGGPIYKTLSENRYPGFLAEHFFNLWLQTYRIRKYEVPIINVEI
jgi:hypothetical protein